MVCSGGRRAVCTLIALIIAAPWTIGIPHAMAQPQAPVQQDEPSPQPQSAPRTAPPATEAASQAAAATTLKERASETRGKQVTEHQLAISGSVLRYRATAATLALKDDSGKAKAEVFYVAYELLPAADASQRPLTFVFNGGPGAAAVWLHLGTAGPRRVALGNDDLPIGPPYRLVDNPDTWLRASDVVFIDPVATGFSRPADGQKPEQFFGVEGDIQSVADFIRLYATQQQRWTSPLFLAGESYGTTRAAGLSEYLLDRYGLALSGVVFISTVLDFSFGGDLQPALELPSLAAVAHYHKRLAPELQKLELGALVAEVQQWTISEYAPALVRGQSLDAAQKQAIAQRLARYTSLPADFFGRNDLRVATDVFRKRLLEEQRVVLGRFDGRVSGFDPDPARSYAGYDPSFTPYLAANSGTFNQYVRTDLRYQSDLPYEVLTGRTHPWEFPRAGFAGAAAFDISGRLQSAMIKNPHLKLLFASGVYDLATPYYLTDYSINHLVLSEPLRANIERRTYPAGHMIYNNDATRAALNDDVVHFIERAAKP